MNYGILHCPEMIEPLLQSEQDSKQTDPTIEFVTASYQAAPLTLFGNSKSIVSIEDSQFSAMIE